MSTLGEDAAKVYLKNQQLFIGLANEDGELTDSNYERQPVVRWDVKRGTGEAEVNFGPFMGGVHFDRVLIFDPDGDLLRVVPFKGGSFRMPSKSMYRHITKISVLDLE